jgi:DNA-binding LacI/PurR family transcriptional regulator
MDEVGIEEIMAAPTKSPTLLDLAKVAGVSASTVSRSLNNHESISAMTKGRVLAIARELGYPTAPALDASEGRDALDDSISIVTPRVHGVPLPLSHPFFLELIASIGEAARDRGCDFSIRHTVPANFDDLLTATRKSRVKGAIFLGQGSLHQAFNRLASSDARFVVWGAQLPGQSYCTVGSDNQLGGRRATLHLIRLGRRRIAFLGGSDPEANQRRAGYLSALSEQRIEPDPALIGRVEFELENAEAAVDALLRQGVKFDAIVAASDLIAVGAIRSLWRSGISVPADVSVVGYDDVMLARLSAPSLSTIRQDTKKAGRLMVSKIIDGSVDNHPEILSAELIVRESCGA